MARNVADISLDGTEQVAHARGLRPAFPDSAPVEDDGPAPALTVQVMDPHDLWDARDGLRPVQMAAAPIEAVAAVVRTADSAGLRPAFAAPEAGPRTVAAIPVRAVEQRVVPRATIQLGAYSSTEAARAAWAGAREGKAREALGGLTPEFETIRLNGKALVRLRVSAPAVTAAAICRAAEVSDPWCLRSR